jgi:dTDP-4-amino-4,6-dideoxygalactose transaminase
MLRLRLERLSITRDAFIQALTRANIGSSVHFIPLHLHPFYRDMYQLSADDFPAALLAYKQVISLPIYPGMTHEDVNDVIMAVEQIISVHRK